MSNEYKTTVYVGTVNGKAVHKTVRAGSQRELNKKVSELKRDIAAGKDVYTNALFGDWAYKWLNECKKPSGLNKGTLTQYESAIKHLNRYFEFTELKKIKLSDFQTAINELAACNPNTNAPSSSRTLKSIITTAADICYYAAANDIAGAPQFFKSVVIPKSAPKKERRALTENEQQWIIETPHRCQPAAMIMMFAGLRRGELVALRWSDVDLCSGIISVKQSADMQDSHTKIKEGGKTLAAVRQIPIPQILLEYLKAYQRECSYITPYVICNTKGKVHTASSFRKMWNSYLYELNIKYGYSTRDVSNYKPDELPMRIERFTPHYLRHTYATMLYLQGVDVLTAKQYLGHADIQVTVNIYTDLKNNSRLTISDEYRKKLQREYSVVTA